MSSRPSPSFDMSTISRNTWIAVGGAVVLLISPFLDWYSVSVGPFSVSASGTKATDVAWLVFLCAVAALVAIGIELFAPQVALPVTTSQIVIGAGVVATLLVLFRMVSKPGGYSGIGLAYGIWIALIAAVVTAVGGYLRLRDETVTAT
jgi:hypothetical protein